MAASRVKEAAPFDDPRQAGWPCFGAQSEGEGRSRPGFGCRPGCGAACDDDHALDPAVRGLPSRSKGFTTTTRRALRAAGVTYFTTLLCTTTTLLNSISSCGVLGDQWDFPSGPFWLYFGRDGHHLPGLRQRLWVQPEEGDCGTLREDAGLCVDRALCEGRLATRSTSPLQWRNHLRAQRRCKDIAWELAQGACAQMEGGRHFAWEWPMDLKYGQDCEATRTIFDRGRALGC